MNYRVLFYSSAIALPLAALALTGVHAATTAEATGTATAPKWGRFEQTNLTDAQKAAVAQAQTLRKQADDILVQAGLTIRHPGQGGMNRKGGMHFGRGMGPRFSEKETK